VSLKKERKNKSTGEVFYGCSNFPRCRYKKSSETSENSIAEIDMPSKEDGLIEDDLMPSQDAQSVIEEIPDKCPRCSNELKERKNKSTGEVFHGCSSFPKCRYTFFKKIANPEEPKNNI